MAKIKPILFNTEMVRAILEGRKTVTRRVVKPQPQGDMYPMPKVDEWPNYYGCTETDELFMPTFHHGDILYVRETWEQSMAGTYLYKATDTPLIHDGWRPSIHMPKEAARIFLRVTDVRVERLRAITEEQSQKEGLYAGWSLTKTSSLATTARQAFMWVWDMTVKPADWARCCWAANPWVWVIEFQRISREETGL